MSWLYSFIYLFFLLDKYWGKKTSYQKTKLASVLESGRHCHTVSNIVIGNFSFLLHVVSLCLEKIQTQDMKIMFIKKNTQSRAKGALTSSRAHKCDRGIILYRVVEEISDRL